MLCTSEDFESNASDDNEVIDDGIDDQKSGDINEHPSVCQDDCVSRKRQYASVYRPREALRIALRDWLALMLQVSLYAHFLLYYFSEFCLRCKSNLIYTIHRTVV